MEGEAFAQGKLKFASYVLTFSARASTLAPGSSKPRVQVRARKADSAWPERLSG